MVDEYNIDVTKVVDDHYRHTCLYYAAVIKEDERYSVNHKNSAYNVLKMFIDRGVLATYTDVLDQTVLYYVARENKINCVEILVKLGIPLYPLLGCSPNHRDQYGQTPLYYAAR